MRDFTKLSPRFWIGETGKKIRGSEAQVIALYLMSCPNATMIGIYYLPLPIIAHETGLPFEGALKGLQTLCAMGFCQYDELSEYVWVCNMALFQVGESLKPNDNRVKSLQEAYASLPQLPFLKDFYNKYQAIFHLTHPRENDSPSEGATKPLQSQEEEQKQDKLQNNCLPETSFSMRPIVFASPTDSNLSLTPTKPVSTWIISPISPSPSEGSSKPLRSQEKEKEKKKEKEREKDISGARLQTNRLPETKVTCPKPDVLITIPLNDKTEFPLSQLQVDEWQVLYPAVDVLQTLRHIRAWNLANPTRCKTRSGILRHITAWLAKEQNQGGRSPQLKIQSSHQDISAHNLRVIEEWVSEMQNDVIAGEVVMNPLTHLKEADYDA